jgi:hypothetical protein
MDHVKFAELMRLVDSYANSYGAAYGSMPYDSSISTHAALRRDIEYLVREIAKGSNDAARNEGLEEAAKVLDYFSRLILSREDAKTLAATIRAMKREKT